MKKPLNDIHRCIIAARLAKIEAGLAEIRLFIDPLPAPYGDIEALKPFISFPLTPPKRAKAGTKPTRKEGAK